MTNACKVHTRTVCAISIFCCSPSPCTPPAAFARARLLLISYRIAVYKRQVYDYAKHASKYAVNVPEASFDLGKIVARKSKVVRKMCIRDSAIAEPVAGDFQLPGLRITAHPVIMNLIIIGSPVSYTHLIKFFFIYQLNYMYWRYFMWNFAGRQNDIQGQGEICLLYTSRCSCK